MSGLKRLTHFSGLIICLLLTSSCFSSAVGGKKSTQSLFQESLQYAGLKRTYWVYVPAAIASKQPLPVVILLHGGGGTGQGMIDKLTRGGMNRLAEEAGFMVVYPDGMEKHWNDGRGLSSNRAHRENIDDVGFILAAMDSLSARYVLDQGRIYVAGISNGGMMSLRLACDAASRFAAVASVAAAMPKALVPACHPSKPISILFMHGTEDQQVPYQGGEIKVGRRRLGEVLSAAESVSFWRNMNGCSPQAVTEDWPDRDPQDGTQVTREFYRECAGPVNIDLYTIVGGGHTWPGGRQYLPEFLIGRTSRELDANARLWEFFAEQRRD